MLVLRILVVALVVAYVMPARAADGGYFIAVGQLKADGAGGYESFLTQVLPIWQRHGMSLVLRTKTRFVMDAKAEPVPDDIAVLRYESRARFNAYLNDPDYQAIKNLRINSMENLAIMEAQVKRTDGLAFMKNTPMTLVQFDSREAETETPALVLDVDLVAPVKGIMAARWKALKQVRFSALSFDDNPMAQAREGALLTLAGDLVR